MNLCRGCSTDFASVGAFDQHRIGVYAYTYEAGLELDPPNEDGRHCMDAAEMRAAGMDLDARGRFCIPANVEKARRAFARAA